MLKTHVILAALVAATLGAAQTSRAQLQLRSPERLAQATEPASTSTLAASTWSASTESRVSRAGPSEGRFNAMLGLGALTSLGARSSNKTLLIGGALATASAYQKWSRRRTRLRSDEYQARTDPANPDFVGEDEEEYEFRKGRGDTAAALALMPAYGIATGKKTFIAAGGVATLLAYRRYRQTRRERARSAQGRREDNSSGGPQRSAAFPGASSSTSREPSLAP